MFIRAVKFVLILNISNVLVLAQQSTPTEPQTIATPTIEKPRVFITDSESWEMRGSVGGANGTFAGHSQGGARPQTAEIIKTFGERCPDVMVNNKQELADYVVVLDHEGGKGYLRHRNKVAVFEHISGDVVVSHSTLSLGGSVEEACKGIVSHWAAHGTDILAAKQKAIAPVPITQAAAVQQPTTPGPADVSVTVDSNPEAADIEVDGNFVGNTPSTISLMQGSHEISVKKKGFVDWTRKMNVTGGSVHLSATLDARSGE
jgi:hypothetical protein